MLRTILSFAAASLVVACSLASGASADRAIVGHARVPSGAAAAEPGQITLRLRYRLGPWKRSLSLRLVKTRLTSFSVCAIRDWQATTEKFGCDVPGGRLPESTNLRLEQTPVARALRRNDSPGWGMLGSSGTARLGAVLSNELTGDRFGTFRYRVTLRSGSGQLLTSSNTLTVVWHR